MELNIHDATEITISKVIDGFGNRKFRVITVKDIHGSEIEIGCFADDSKSLKIKKQK